VSDGRGCKPAPYAVREAASRGRVHPQPEDPMRSAFARDRERVLQSTAFRRLEYKTQVFMTREHDHFRTRLTHTLEVAELARRLAVALRVNESLAEVIALAHDLGHPPFGHAGEAALNRLMRDHGGFEHNVHSLRVVDFLEHPFPPFRGLNLSYEVREGLAKHETAYDRPGEAVGRAPALTELFASGTHGTVEGQIASLADRLAYDCHDVEDALGAGLIDERALSQTALWRQAAAPIRGEYPNLSLPAVRRPILNALADMLVFDAISETLRRIAEQGIRTPDDVRRAPDPVVALPDPANGALVEFEALLLGRVYRHERLAEMDARAAGTVAAVFGAYLEEPGRLPPRFARRTDREGVHRVVCDYVAGMTDRFCERERLRLEC